jgi:putative membrane protein
MNATLKKLIAGIAAAIGWLTLVLPGAAEQNADAKFLVEAIRIDLAHERLGELAAQRSESERVRHFGERLCSDHGHAMEATAELAQALNVAGPPEPGAPAEQQYQSLAQLSGGAFDQAFIDAMIERHRDAIAKFKKEVEDGDDLDVTGFARATLPKLEDHLAMALSLQDRSTRSGT